MKIPTEFNLVTWLRLVKFTELNISEFGFLNFNYIRCYFSKYNSKQNLNSANLPLAS